MNILIGSPDPYFAYNPIRFLFPALSLTLVIWAQGNATRSRFFSLGLFAGIGLAWNLDSGVAVLAALAAFVITSRFTVRNHINRILLIDVILRLLSFVCGVTISCSLFLAYLAFKSGWHVDLSNYVTYQKLFYISGFAMLPIPAFPDWWTIPAVTIGVVLMFASAKAGRCSAGGDPATERAAYMAILMIGVGLYYTGRSHWLVLRFVIWPAIVLFFFMADRAYSMIGQLGPWRWMGIGTVSVLVGLPLSLVVNEQSEVRSVLNILSAPQPSTIQVAEDLSFIRAHTSVGESIGIIAYNQGTFYGETGTRPAIPGPGIAELLRSADRDAEQKSILRDGPEKLFFNSSNVEEFKFDMNAISKVYSLVERGPGDRLMYLRRNSYVQTSTQAGK